MKSAAFIKLMAETLTMPESTATDYARRLKEAGLLSTGARGVNAPEMTPLDAARFLIAVLTTPSPAQCVERVQRFGQIKYSPSFQKIYRGYETIQPEEFSTLFQGETLEEVLASLFDMPRRIGINAACAWQQENIFHLRVHDFEVLAELFSWVMEGKQVIGERVVPFKGKVWEDHVAGQMPRRVEGWTPITGGVRTERSVSGLHFISVGVCLMPEPKEDGS